MTVTSDEIPGSADWIECDILDISVTIGSTYYIVVRSTGGSVTSCAQWLFGVSTPYTDGLFHFSSTDGSTWTPYSSYDYCFKTYGLI